MTVKGMNTSVRVKTTGTIPVVKSPSGTHRSVLFTRRLPIICPVHRMGIPSMFRARTTVVYIMVQRTRTLVTNTMTLLFETVATCEANLRMNVDGK